LINSVFGAIKQSMEIKFWEKPTVKEYDSAKDFIQGAGTIDGVRKEVGTPTDSAFADSIVSP
tara:strand:+ start:819 stop:1004 length:186 start_codon:yes stop_codon:yes gene_type:complete